MIGSTLQLRTIFPKNLKASGRWLRAIVGIALLVFAYFAHSWWLFAGALFTFFEAYMSWCILLHFLGNNSCRIKKKK
ncbi:MAG: DUF2892 domain-containing protein [Rhabdochlamydiaceae bacterium]|nr:DUF2892 domain-containing protein [Rhabdochlamydiaceae bacterium]